MGKLKPNHVYMSYDEEDEGACRFIRSLSAALEAQGLTVFRRHHNLPYYLLHEAMEKSWVWIVVFSKNYAASSSSFCLKELAHFAGCGYSFRVPRRAVRYNRGERVMGERMEADMKKVNNVMGALNDGPHLGGWSEEKRAIIGVYYDVDPQSIVQHILQHVFPPDRFESEDDQEERRKAVLQLITSLPDIHQPNHSSGSQAIPKIVQQVTTKVDEHFYKLFGFVGIQSQVEEAEELLELSRDDEVRVVGICGMSGLGKSSIATVLYLKIFYRFDAFCFLSNVSARLKHGDISLHELLHRHLGIENEAAWSFLDEEFLACKRLINHKFLIVLDGVDLAQHLQEMNLDEISDCFGAGSRIIITTRDEQVLRQYDIGTIYRPKLLSKEEASELFCSKAFTMEYRTDEFKEMIDRAVEYANGLPLAIATLGSYLYGKGVAERRSYLRREEIVPPFEIIMVLRKCYDELDDMSKEMFLDIACFFVGKDINYVKEILQDCFSCDVDIKIKLLIQKSIFKVVNERIQMHGMLQAMGREIVRELCPNQPDKLSRLYLFRDIKYAMEKGTNMGMENNVEAIALDLEEPNTTPLSIDALLDMDNLRLLIFRNVKVSGSLDNLPSELRYVLWHQYPFTALPSSFQSDTLVQLIMPESNMSEVWEGKMWLPMLKKMNLCGSKTLTKTPDFGEVPNLERLELEGCIGLLQVDASVAELSTLKILNLRGCINLVSIPNSLFSVNSLEILNLAGCSKFAYCLDFSLNEELNTSEIIARHLDKEANTAQKDEKNDCPHTISRYATANQGFLITTRQEPNAPQTHLHVGHQSYNDGSCLVGRALDGPTVHSPRPTVTNTQGNNSHCDPCCLRTLLLALVRLMSGLRSTGR